MEKLPFVIAPITTSGLHLTECGACSGMFSRGEPVYIGVLTAVNGTKWRLSEPRFIRAFQEPRAISGDVCAPCRRLLTAQAANKLICP